MNGVKVVSPKHQLTPAHSTRLSVAHSPRLHIPTNDNNTNNAGTINNGRDGDGEITAEKNARKNMFREAPFVTHYHCALHKPSRTLSTLKVRGCLTFALHSSHAHFMVLARTYTLGVCFHRRKWRGGPRCTIY